mgnify:CR=1 FL=1
MTVTSVTPLQTLNPCKFWRSGRDWAFTAPPLSWDPLFYTLIQKSNLGGPGPPGPPCVFLFLFPPPPRPLWSARPPTDREFNSARPWLPCIHKCYPYEDLTSVPAEGVLAELASAASGHGCLFATTLNTLLYLAKYNIDAPTWKTPFASLYTQWH